MTQQKITLPAEAGPALLMLQKALKYENDTGRFVWITGSRNRFRKVGGEAGTINRWGYRAISFGGKYLMAHRLAWLYTNGEWPINEIDHINGDRLDNRIENLRDVSRSINAQNIRSARCDSESKALGVSWSKCKRKWIASIVTNGKQKYLGSFAAMEDASEAYLAAKRVVHAGCTI